MYKYYNNIGAEGIKVIGEALKVNASLHTLNLYCNYIGVEGGKVIGESIIVKSRLRPL